ncbi:Coiled-coil-helix-coiled-coil-helix domain-containing protein 1 [Phytophthora cinnamomi]|uniref:Coiled-coil-helix-coiled-coil-helix domain-containing protein 1 n=1 Tax=Phytophthora cinnamomi TaxID=4785 RepID=UPI003559F9A9|nr:Coiled-coil-helix-coiled-coil-helix domain-containing protein 1 [Phytophthora cinnamomi]
MKLGRGINVEHIKRMTLRTVRERTEGQPETLAFLDALERNDFDETKCKREARHMMLVLEAKRKRRAAEHRSTLNFHVIRMMKGHHDPRR